MASTTTEVLRYFGTDDTDFEDAVNAIRFSREPPMETREIIDLIKPIYLRGYYDAKEEFEQWN